MESSRREGGVGNPPSHIVPPKQHIIHYDRNQYVLTQKYCKADANFINFAFFWQNNRLGGHFTWHIRDCADANFSLYIYILQYFIILLHDGTASQLRAMDKKIKIKKPRNARY